MMNTNNREIVVSLSVKHIYKDAHTAYVELILERRNLLTPNLFRPELLRLAVGDTLQVIVSPETEK